MRTRGVWSVVAVLVVAATGAVFGAEPREDVQAAVNKLVDGGSFSWTMATDVEDVLGAVGGMKDKDTTLYIVSQLQATSTVLEQGGKVVVKMDDGTWKTVPELAQIAADARVAQNASRAAAQEAGIEDVPRYEPILYNSLQIASLPTVEMKALMAGLKEVKKADGVYTAELSPDLAADLLMNRKPGTGPATAPASAPASAPVAASAPVGTASAPASAPMGRGRRPEPTSAKCTLKFTLKDGVVVKYDVHVSGVFVFGGQERPQQRSYWMEFSDIGTAKVTVPPEAKAKLAAMPAESKPANAPARP